MHMTTHADGFTRSYEQTYLGEEDMYQVRSHEMGYQIVIVLARDASGLVK